MKTIQWGIIGCGDVTEIKSGPGFQKADGSSLVAVMRRDRAKAEDYAHRHGVPRVHSTADNLISDPDVDAVYIATPPGSHCELAVKVAGIGKPCLVEKPMARSHAECLQMVHAFAGRSLPLWVAYYRRALPRFLRIREVINAGTIGRVTSVHLDLRDVLSSADEPPGWLVDPDIAGAGHFFDVGCHGIDILDFLIGRISRVAGFAVNTGGAYATEDVTAATFLFENQILGTGVWNFNADRKEDTLLIRGSHGSVQTSLFPDADVIVSTREHDEVYPIRNPPHVHQPLIQTIVNELHGNGHCESTGESGARASWVLDECVREYYDTSKSTG